MEKFITLERPNNVIDMDTAKDNILSFIISSVKTDRVNKEDFYKLLPSFYSFCYHKKLEEGCNLREIEFKEDDKYNDNSTSAFSFANEVHFCPYLAQNSSQIINVFDLIDSTFHEISHVSEFYNANLRSNTHQFHDSHFGNIQEDSINIYLSLCKRNIGKDDLFKCPNDFAYEDKAEEILNYLNKLYFFDENEQNARSFATNSILELMEYSTNKELSDEDKTALDKFRITHFNLHLINKTNMLNIKQSELRDVTKKELLEYTEKLHSDLKEYIQIRRELDSPSLNEDERKIQLLKTNQIINNAEMNIIGMLGVNYDENLANSFAETLLSINEEFRETNPLAFPKLIETTKFSPTKEQFIRCAKNFRNNFNNSNELNNISEFKTPLTPFIYHFSSCYHLEILLRTYGVDNNDFLSDLLKYEDGLVSIDKSTLDKIREDYLLGITADNLEYFSSSIQNLNITLTNEDVNPNSDTNLDYKLDNVDLDEVNSLNTSDSNTEM